MKKPNKDDYPNTPFPDLFDKEEYFEERDKLWDLILDEPNGWVNDGYFTTANGHKIRHGFAPHQAEDKRGTVVITHGYGENMDLYYETVKYYQAKGFDVHIMDWHGQGLSGRANPKKHSAPASHSFERHSEDLHEFIENIVKQTHNDDDDLPLVLSTNSMGGHVGMLYMNDHPKTFDGAIMSSPMLRGRFLGLPRCTWPIIKCAFKLATKLGLRDTHLTNDWQNILRFARRSKDSIKLEQNVRTMIIGSFAFTQPEAMIGTPTIGWLTSTFNTTVRINQPEHLKDIETPTLIGAAGLDPFIDTTVHEEAYEHLQNCDLIEFPHAHHTLWRDSDDNTALWWDHIETFLQKVERHKKGEKVAFDERVCHEEIEKSALPPAPKPPPPANDP